VLNNVSHFLSKLLVQSILLVLKRFHRLPQAHFLTGYVIQPGHAVRGYTNVPGTPPPNQAMILWLTGYMPIWVWWWTRPNVPPVPRAALTGGEVVVEG
jgi:hypothetical protein